MTANEHHHHHRWAILAVLGLSQLMVVLDATIVNIALPSAQESLGFSNENRQWIVTAYALAFGSLLLLGGRLGDLLGRRRVFIIGLVGFAVASAIGGAAQSFGVLVTSRALQGVFGALLAPAALGLLTTTFTDPEERAKAFGVFGAIAGAGAAIGLLLGGVLTELLSWRWCLYVNLLLAGPAVFGAISLLRHEQRGAGVKLDIPGTLTATAGLFALVYGFSNAETSSWGDSTTIAMFVAAAVLLTGFVLLQRRVSHPLLPLRIVLHRDRGAAYLAMALASVAMFGVFLFLTFYLQQNLGMSPIAAGAAFLPMSFTIIATATTVTTKVVPRVGPRPLVTAGMLLGALSMLLFTRIGLDSTYLGTVLPALLVMGLGLGLIFAPAFASATLGVPDHDAGVASAMVNTSQQVGGALGTALLSTIAANAATSFATTNGPAADLAAQAAVHGYTSAFWFSAGVFAFAAIVCGLLFRPGVPHALAAGAGTREPILAH